MVKKVWSFLRWQAARLTWDDYCWFIGFGLIGAGFGRNENLILAGLCLVVAALLGTIIKNQWQRWKEERKDLLNTIKDAK